MSDFRSNPADILNTGANQGGASSNADLLLDIAGDNFNSSATGQSASSQGQSSLFDPSFDLMSSGTTETVKPAGGPSDPWGDFASAR